MMEESVQEGTTIVSTYVPTIRALKYIKQMLTNMNRKVYNSTIIGNFYILLPTLARLSRS